MLALLAPSLRNISPQCRNEEIVSPNEMEGPGTSKDTAGRGAQGTARKEMGVLWGLNVIDTFAQSRRRGHLGQVPLLLVPKEFNKSPIKMIQGAKATEQYQPLRLTDVFCIVSSSICAYSCALWMPWCLNEVYNSGFGNFF